MRASTSDRERMQSEISYTAPLVRLGLGPEQAELRVPEQIELGCDADEPVLRWSRATTSEAVDAPQVFLDFVRLPVGEVDGPISSGTANAVLAFARKNGVLYRGSKLPHWPEGRCPPLLDTRLLPALSDVCSENVREWVCHVRRINAVLRAVARLRRSDPIAKEDWDLLFRERSLFEPLPYEPTGHPPKYDTPTYHRLELAAHVNRMLHSAYMVPRVQWLGTCEAGASLHWCDDVDTWDWLDGNAYGAWLRRLDGEAGQVGIAIAGCHHARPSVPLLLWRPRPSPLFSLLVGRLASIFCARDGVPICDYCNLPYRPESGRRPASTKRSVCGATKCRAANHSERQREWVARHRSKVRSNPCP